MSTHLENVLMQQSYGPKSTMPTSRDTGELLLALNEFNKYELFTGTGTGVQPLFSDGTGTSNVSFTVNQDSADSVNGKFVYFDETTNTWKPAYASAIPSAGAHYTAQGFAISLNSTGIQVTTSGKLIIPFRLTDYTGASVVAGSYYYLCQTEANAGMIQQSAPSSGIMQIVCQIIAVDDTSTTLLLLNDLSQVANDIIITDGDGSKYLGDDGQYHDMMVAGLAGRTSNCLDTYEILDINFENIAAGRSAATEYEFPTLSANGTWDNTTAAAAISGTGYTNENAAIAYTPTTLFNITAGTNQVFTATDSVNNNISWKFLQSTFLTTITIVNHTDSAQTDNMLHTAILAYADEVGNWTNTNYTITVPTNTAGAQYTLEIPLELSKQWGAHKFWNLRQITSFSGSTETFATNKITPSGYYYTDATGTPSYGYIVNGDITIEDNIASNFSSTNYIISKYLVENNSQWSFRVRKKFDQVTNEDPIWQSPNKTNYLAIENGALKLVLNGLSYKGNLVYTENTWYDFKINYNMDTGYVISSSSDNSNDPSWTNEIILYDETNYMDGTTWYIGVASQGEEWTAGTGQVNLEFTGLDHLNGEQSFDTYPLSDLTAKDISTITVTFKGTGLVAQGRANNTTTLNAQSVEVDTVKNTIIAGEGETLLWDTSKGLTTANYTEVDYLRQYEDEEQGTVLYARDTNLCYSYTIVYPNFLQTNVTFNTDAQTVKPNCILVGDIQCNNGVLSNFSPYNYVELRNSFNPENNPWEAVIKWTSPATFTDGRIIDSGALDTYKPSFGIGTNASGMLRLWASSGTGDTAWDIASDVTATTALAVNTTYYIKLSFTGTQYLVQAATVADGPWTTYITVDSELPITLCKTVSLGIGTMFYTTGTIDLKESYISINGENWWEGAIANPDQNNVKLDLSGANATFHPNTFLNRNGFNFQLKLDLTGNLKLDRTLDARNYGSTQSHPFYYQVQGVDWSTFQADGGYVQGIKMSAALGSTNTGTANGSLYQLTVNDANYADASYGAQNACGPVFFYFAFENPINFNFITFRNYSDANYIPAQFCVHVSNDMNTWESVLTTNTAGYTTNGMFGRIPIDVYASWSNTTVNALFNYNIQMPDVNQYYKYVRIGLYGGDTDTYRPLISGCWIGARYFSSLAESAQSARELIFEKQNFINTESSGINAQVVRKKVGTAYQVRFLDKIGYVETAPEDGVTDVTGKQLAPNDEEIYKDERLQNYLTVQRLAYQTHCPIFLNADRDYCYSSGTNPFNYSNDGTSTLQVCANTGAVASSYALGQNTATTYAFNNGLNESSIIITFTNSAFVGHFYMQNHTTAGYSPQQIKVYGATKPGYFEGTYSNESGTQNPDAEWEEIPILNIVTAYNDGDFTHFAPTEQMNTYVETASTNAITKIGTPVANDSYGAYNLYIAPKRSYLQYRVTVQRTTNNSVTMMTVLPRNVWFDPWSTPLKSDGTNAPLVLDNSVYLSSSATVLPDKSSITSGIYASSFSPTTVWQLYGSSNNGNWTPENSRRYVHLQQAYPYAVNMNNILLQHGNDLNYAANLFEYYGTNLTSLATTALSNNNSLSSWTRITSLIDRADIPTAVSTTQKNNALLLGDREYGYSYFTAIFRRSINNQIYMDSFKGNFLTSTDYLSDTATTNYLNASKYVEEWKWTNVAGEKDEIRNASCYNHPLLQTGDTSSLEPTYELTSRPVYNPDSVETIGEPVITSNGILTSSTGNYCRGTFNLPKEFEVNLRYRLNSMPSTVSQQLLSLSNNTNTNLFGIYIGTGGNIEAYLTNGGGYFGSLSPELNAWKTFNVKVTDTQIISTDGSTTRTVEITDAYLSKIWTGETFIQLSRINEEGYSIEVDIANTYIKSNGKTVWSGAYPNTFYTSEENTEGNYLPNNTAVNRTTSLVDNKTFPYENRWMYQFTDSEGETWYSPGAPTGTAGTVNSYMYKNIIPKYNTNVYTGIPMTATADEGSENGYTYFDQTLTIAPSNVESAWRAFCSTTNATDISWCSGDAFDSTTGLCTEEGRDIYVGFQAPEALTIQGYTIKGVNSSGMTGIAQWEFQGSNNGTDWTTIDTRDTEKAENPDTPVDVDDGTSYFFDNNDSYTQYRWLIKKITPGVKFCRLQCTCLYVLEENPIKVYSIFVLNYTDHESVQHTAYTNVTGSSGQFIGNNQTIYSDINLQTPITNVWAYQVSDGTHQYYTKVAGDADAYAPETTMIYEDADFSVEFGEALVDTWQYTGVINQKYSYTGQQLNNFTWDGEEPYNKYFYTGNVANQYKYTGKIEGWTYTGVTKDIYDIVPNFHLSLNRDDARKIQKATLLGNAYPVATSSSDLATTAYYSFTSSDVAGTIVPSGTPLYSNITDTEPSATADGTNNYVFGSAPSQSRYEYEYLYTAYNDLPDGQTLTGDEQAYQDANLTVPAPEDTNLTEYTYTSEYEASHMTDFYHPINEVTPVEDYNFGLQFDGSKYTFTCYADGGTTDVQEYQNGTLIKSSYQGPDASVRNSSVIMMTQQDLLRLNLTKSTYSWWTWNNLTQQNSTRTTANIFRLATIDGSSTSIEDIFELYPWRVGEASSIETTAIGDPIVTLSNKLKSNEIWLEGQELEIRKYRKLYQVYGNTYGEASDADHFVVPNFVGRSIWGISSTSQFGYIEAGLPSITHNHSATSTTTSSSASAGAHTHSTNSTGAHTHTRGTMNITGSFYARVVDGNNDTTGAFSSSSTNLNKADFEVGSETGDYQYSFNASRNWTGKTSENGAHTHTANSSGAHTHTITSTTSTTIANNSSVNSIYGKTSTVRPPSIGIRVKTRAK